MPQIHFLYDSRKEPDASFAQSLIHELGQTGFSAATHVVSIGGDGKLLHALRSGRGKKIAGVMPPGSGSYGFWTNRGISTAADLTRFFNTAQSYPIKPLRGDIEFADGSKTVRYGYNDIGIVSTHKELSEELKDEFDLPDTDVSVQSVLLNLKVSFARAVIGPTRVMGNGLVFATAFGSTAMNRSYDGPAIDIRHESIILTGNGIHEPDKGFNSTVNSGDAVFDIEALSLEKRPVMVSYDSYGVIKERGNGIRKLKVSMAHDRIVDLMLADDPGRRAYSAMMP